MIIPLSTKCQCQVFQIAIAKKKKIFKTIYNNMITYVALRCDSSRDCAAAVNYDRNWDWETFRRLPVVSAADSAVADRDGPSARRCTVDRRNWNCRRPKRRCRPDWAEESLKKENKYFAVKSRKSLLPKYCWWNHIYINCSKGVQCNIGPTMIIIQKFPSGRLQRTFRIICHFRSQFLQKPNQTILNGEANNYLFDVQNMFAPNCYDLVPTNTYFDVWETQSRWWICV